MGEHVRWANLGEPIYAEKDLEIFRPAQQQSTLPVYYLKAWLPYAADTVFNSLFDARYRCEWDAANTKQLAVIERRSDGDVMYCAQSMQWPFADRDYVYHRRAKFFRKQHAFVVACQAMHHSSAPQCNGLVRVETYALRLCIRSTGTSSCDLYVEYEDDTNFSIPNYAVNLLLAAHVPSFMHALRAACASYANYIKTLPDSSVETIPSQVVRRKSDESATAGTTTASSCSSRMSEASVDSAQSRLGTAHRTVLRSHRRESKRSTHSDGAASSEDTASRATTSTTRSSLRLRALLKSKTTPASHKHAATSLPSSPLKKTASAGTLYAPTLSLSSVASSSLPSRALGLDDDDFAIAFYKQKIGLHLETDLFSNRVLVAYCEKDSEAARASVCIESGMLVTSVNGSSVAHMTFSEILHAIKTSTRPLTLGFTHADHAVSKTYRRFKAPKNVLKCFVARDEHDLVRALRPLNEDASVSAVLKTDFCAPAYSKKRVRASMTSKSTRATFSSGTTSSTTLLSSSTRSSSGGNSSSSKRTESDLVVVPEGYLVYEIDDCYVLDLAFAEIAHLLRRNSEPRVVTFKAALAVEGDRVTQDAARSALSKRLSGVFKWRSTSFDEPSSSASATVSERPRTQPPPHLSDDSSSSSHRRTSRVAQTPALSNAAPVPLPIKRSDPGEIKWSDASPGACLPDYSNVTITHANLAWAWEHVHLLKADERIFSAAMLIEKLETHLMRDGSSSSESTAAAAKAMLTAMHEERAFVSRIKERNQQGLQALREFNCEVNTDWQFGQTYVGVTTHWKPGEDGTVWLKLDGLVEGVDIFNTIAVIRETDLYNVWVPFCNRSELLLESGHVDVVAYMSVAFPLLQRDAIIKAFGINACYESRAILLLGKTEDESTLPRSVHVPRIRGWNADRMEMRGFRALIEPITRTKARVCIVANIDPKCPIPRSLLNFGIKKVAGILLYLVRKEAEKIEQAQREGLTDNEHLRRIERDPTQFYAWLDPLMGKWFDDQSCNVLPPPMALTALNESVASSSRDAIGANAATDSSSENAAPRKTSRTTPFHHPHQHSTEAPTEASERVRSERHDPTSSRQRMLIDYLYDFGIWPYLLMFIFSQVTPETGFLHVCLLKFVFTCTCTWFGVPGAFSWQTRRLKRARRELDPLRRRCVVLAGLCDVLNSWFLRVWAHWLVCYVPVIVHKFVLLLEHQEKLLRHRQDLHATGSSCFDRTPLEVRESENFWLIGSAFLFATVVVGIQIVVNI